MKNISKLAVALSLSGVMFAAVTLPASADTTQTQTSTINCTAGAYGQNSTCTTSTSQNQTVPTNVLGQTIVYNRQGVPTTTPLAPTAVDPTILTAGIATIVTTAGGAILTLKKKRV